MAGLNGFVKLHRKMIEWGWYSDCVVKDVFLHIIMTANYAPGQYMGHELKPGDAIIGLKKLSSELGFSIQQVRTALKKLESTGEISIFSTNRFSIASVENWAFYQCEDDDSNKRATNEQQTNNKRATNEQQHLKKERKKEGKKERNIFSSPSLQEVEQYCHERGNRVDAQKFISYYESNGWKVGKNPMKDWKAAVRTWERSESGYQMQKQSRSKIEQHGVDRLLAMLNEVDDE